MLSPAAWHFFFFLKSWQKILTKSRFLTQRNLLPHQSPSLLHEEQTRGLREHHGRERVWSACIAQPLQRRRTTRLPGVMKGHLWTAQTEERGPAGSGGAGSRGQGLVTPLPLAFLCGSLFTQLKTVVYFLSFPCSKFRAFGRPESQQAHSSGLINKKEIPYPNEERNKVAVITPYPGGGNTVPLEWLRLRGPSAVLRHNLDSPDKERLGATSAQGHNSPTEEWDSPSPTITPTRLYLQIQFSLA